ncbi:trimeric intracellular cation channel family protein [Candidatus Poribacteria bacterium]|nr:trimeric intracellular cation channel family protein [Candidatus Poribacteria bacterium]
MPFMKVIYILDLLGTFAFSAYGSYAAMKKSFDIFGVFIAAFLTALGGGTIRELILGNIPFYFYDNNYVYIILVGCTFSIVIYKYFDKINKYMLIVDAIGLITFAFIGATKASEAGLGSFAIIFLAATTAVGGGLLRDVAMKEIPQIFYRDFYASPAIILGLLYAIFRRYMHQNIYIIPLIVFTFALRLLAIFLNFKLPIPYKKSDSRQIV